MASDPTEEKEIFDLVNNILKNTYEEFKKDDKMNLRSSSKESFEDSWSNMMPLLTASVSAIMIAMEKKRISVKMLNTLHSKIIARIKS